MNIELRKLRHMSVLAEELNFARAAGKLNLTQSALSRSIQALEAELGGALFDRDLRKVTLTPFGRQILPRARQLLQDAVSLGRDVDLMRNGDFGDVVFGAGPFPGGTMLPPILAQLAREHPHLHVEVEINNWQILTQHLLDERIEFFIADVRNVVKNRRLLISRLGRQYGSLFCRAGHPLAGVKLHTPSQVLDYPSAAVRLPVEILQQLGQYLDTEHSDSWVPNLICDNPALLLAVTLNSDAIMLSTYAAASGAVADGSLVAINMPNQPKFFTDMGIVSLAGRTLSPAAAWLVDAMRLQAELLAGEFQNDPPAAGRKRGKS
ncbi:MAG TPA: LysR family transcriptional regulator [Burkholderiaceae bacterium]|jgi:DNA-binding transcriptional LysR family regulator